jgi:outer membrane protein TolC
MKILKYIFLIISFFGSIQISFPQSADINFYIKKAKENNLLLHQIRNKTQISDIDYTLQKIAFSKPEININGGILIAPIISNDNNIKKFQSVSEGATNYAGYDLGITNGGQYQAVVSVNQPLFNKQRIGIAEIENNIQKQADENDILITETELEKLVKYQYLMCLSAQKQVEFAHKMIKENEKQLIIMRKLVDNGIYKQSDFILTEIEFQNYKDIYENYLSEFYNNIAEMNTICGISDTSKVKLNDVDFKLKNENFNPLFLKKFEIDSFKIISKQNIFDLKYKPQLSIFADAGLNAVYLPAFNRFGFSAGLQFSWNIYDGKQKNIYLQKSKVSLENIDFEKNYILNQKNIQKNKIFNQISSIDKRIALKDSRIQKFEKLIEIYKIELSNGQISVIDYINSTRNYSSVLQENIILKMQKQALINEYNYLNY